MMGLTQILLLIISFLCAAESYGQLRAGATKISLVPASVKDVPMSGYARGYEALSKGLHDSLFARIIVLEEEGTVIAIASVDLIGFNVDRAPHAGRLGMLLHSLGVDHWFIVSTHTHGGPRVLDLGKPYVADRNWPQGMPYVNWVEDQILGGVKSALNNLERVSVQMGNGKIELGFNRRLVHEDGRVEMIWGRGREFPKEKLGPTDPEVGVVRFDRANGTAVALLYTYSCHAVVLGAANRLLTADYPGYASALIERELQGAPALFLQGAAGDIDPLIDVQNRFEPAQTQGEALGEEVVRVALGDLEKATAEPLLRWHEVEADFGRFEKAQRTVPVRLSMVGLGDRWAMLGMPGEPFVELGLYFKKWAPVDFPYVIGYTNGYAGYFPTKKAHEEGGYGANYGDTMHLSAESGEEMVALGLEWVNRSQWVMPLPKKVSSGGPVELQGMLALNGSKEEIESVFLDVSVLGGPERYELTPRGSNKWMLDWDGHVEWPLGAVSLPFYKVIRGQVEPLMREKVEVEPGGDWIVWDGENTPWPVEVHPRVDWSEEEEFQGEYEVVKVHIDPAATSSLGAFWTMDWRSPIPVSPRGFMGLAFEFHPGSLGGERLPLIVAGVGEKTINFLKEDDYADRKWQKVFIPQGEFRDLDSIERLRFWGRGQGTFYLRNIRWKYVVDRTFVASENRSNFSTNTLDVWPNPFNGATVLRYAISEDGPFSMVIYNALGQRIRTLFDTWLVGGSYQTVWDGRGDGSHTMASGIYVVRLARKDRLQSIAAKVMHVQ